MDKIIKSSFLRIYSYLLGILFLSELIYYNILDDMTSLGVYVIFIYSISSFIRIKNIDINFQWFLIYLAISVYISAFILWIISIIGVHVEQIVYLICIFTIIFSVQKNRDTIKCDIKFIKQEIMSASFFDYTFSAFIAIVYIAVASHPAIGADSLAKHIAIPIQILNRGILEYNVIESVVFGEASLLAHMSYLFVYIFGAENLQILNVLFALFVLLLLREISKKISTNKVYLYLIVITCLTMPLFFVVSTTLLVDIPPLIFILALILLISIYIETQIITKQMIVFSILLVGGAFFSKQTSVYVLVPVIPILIYMMIKNIQQSTKLLKKDILLILFILLIITLPYLYVFVKTGNPLFPFMNSIFHSDYFSPISFKDSRWESIGNLYEIVFQSSKYIEAQDGVLGLYLLLILFIPFIFYYYRKNKIVWLLVYLSIFSYLIAIEMTRGYLRYLLPTFILITPVVFLMYPMMISTIKNRIVQAILFTLLLIPNTLFSIHYDLTQFTLGIKLDKTYLFPSDSMAMPLNEDILKHINEKDIWILSNDPYRGTFKGRWFSLDLYGTFFQSLLTKKIISVNDFLDSFDYFLYKKNEKKSYFGSTSFFNRDQMLEKKSIKFVAENQTHILYRIIMPKNYIPIIFHSWDDGIHISLKAPLSYNFRVDINKIDNYKLKLILDGAKDDRYSRFQINWLDKNNTFISTSLIPFKIDKYKREYEYIFNKDTIPYTATSGIVYLTGHRDNDSIIAYSIELSYETKTFLKELIQKYINHVITYDLLKQYIKEHKNI